MAKVKQEKPDSNRPQVWVAWPRNPQKWDTLVFHRLRIIFPDGHAMWTDGHAEGADGDVGDFMDIMKMIQPCWNLGHAIGLYPQPVKLSKSSADAVVRMKAYDKSVGFETTFLGNL